LKSTSTGNTSGHYLETEAGIIFLPSPKMQCLSLLPPPDVFYRLSLLAALVWRQPISTALHKTSYLTQITKLPRGLGISPQFSLSRDSEARCSWNDCSRRVTGGIYVYSRDQLVVASYISHPVKRRW
jgi:hypothetical protein